MYAAETMTREEFRKARREQVLQEQRTHRKKVLLFFLTLIVMFGVGVGFGTLLAKAEEPETDSMYKYYTSIKVEPGDTLWDLAELYMDDKHYDTRMDYIYEVININHMMTDRLTAGKKLIIPYYSDEKNRIGIIYKCHLI